MGPIFVIVIGHSQVHALQTEAFHGLGGQLEPLVHHGELFGRKLAQHPVHLTAAREFVADAEAQAGVLLCAEHLTDAPQTVVPALAAGGLEAQVAEGQRQIVDGYEQVLQGNVALVHPVAHGVAAQVHVGGGLEQDEFIAPQGHLGDKAVALVLEGDACLGCQSVDDAKSDVVACLPVLVADVSQARYEKIYVCHISLLCYGRGDDIAAASATLEKNGRRQVILRPLSNIVSYDYSFWS